jgi:hypothetical protein
MSAVVKNRAKRNRKHQNSYFLEEIGIPNVPYRVFFFFLPSNTFITECLKDVQSWLRAGNVFMLWVVKCIYNLFREFSGGSIVIIY